MMLERSVAIVIYSNKDATALDGINRTSPKFLRIMISTYSIIFLVAVAIGISSVDAFQQTQIASAQRVGKTSLFFFGNNKKEVEPEPVEEEPKKLGFMGDLKGMMNNFDAVVDDFLFKRMGNGEQWYGKRKYNPSGNVEGDYNGMGQSDLIRIEIARVRKEEMEKLRQRRLEEQEASKAGKGPKKF